MDGRTRARAGEHYRELVVALPPLDAADHLLDAGCSTGKLAALVARGYPMLGRVTLLMPNEPKQDRAAAKLRELLPKARRPSQSASEVKVRDRDLRHEGQHRAGVANEVCERLRSGVSEPEARSHRREERAPHG